MGFRTALADPVPAIWGLRLALFCLVFHPGCRPPPATAAQTRYLMGTLVSVTVAGTDSLRCVRVVNRAFDAMKRVDRMMSTYRPESPLSRLNRTGHEGWVQLPPPLFTVIASAWEYARLSDGAFDATVGPLVRLWGFYDKQGRLPDPTEEAEVRGRIGYRHAVLDSARGAVRFDLPGVEIDLGGIAKGYALDQAVCALRAEGIKAATVDAGGNLFLVGGPAFVGILFPGRDDSLAFRVEVENEAVSTSGSSENSFLAGGVRYSHIFDPRTGRPVRNTLLSVTVVAPTGLASDALSTAAFVLGPERGMDLVEQTGTAGAIFLQEDPGHNGEFRSRISSRLRNRIF